MIGVKNRPYCSVLAEITKTCVLLGLVKYFKKMRGNRLPRSVCFASENFGNGMRAWKTQLLVNSAKAERWLHLSPKVSHIHDISVWLGPFKIECMFCIRKFWKWNARFKNTTQIPEIYTSLRGQKLHDFIRIASWRDDWPLSITLPLQMFTIVWDTNTFEGWKWLLSTSSLS